MENHLTEQLEVLKTLVEFNVGVVKNMHIIMKELSGERLEDTDALLNATVEAMNWELQVMNGTISLLNEEEKHIDQDLFNYKIVTFNNTLQEKNDMEIANAIQTLIPEFENLADAAQKVIAHYA